MLMATRRSSGTSQRVEQGVSSTQVAHPFVTNVIAAKSQCRRNRRGLWRQVLVSRENSEKAVTRHRRQTDWGERACVRVVLGFAVLYWHVIRLLPIGYDYTGWGICRRGCSTTDR